MRNVPDHNCPRCGSASFTIVEGCVACGHPPGVVGIELDRQDRFLAHELKALVDVPATDVAARVEEMRTAALKRVDERVAERRARLTAKATPSIAASAATTIATPQPTTNATTIAKAPPPRPPPAPPIDPAAARLAFQRRLELGVWFVGALFAVGGSLWATNLFWGDIPVEIRPGVVGGGLSLFAAAFMAVGAMLASRYSDSIAGRVLGLVGGLIAVSAAIPFSTLMPENPVLAIGFDVIALALLAGALRFAGRKGSVAERRSNWFFLGAWALLVLAPRQELAAFAVACACAFVMRASISTRTDDALANKPVWSADLMSIAAGITGVALALDGGQVSTSCVMVVVALLVDSCARLFAQRRPLFAFDTFTRWLSVITAAICSCVAAGNANSSSDDVFTALSLAITGAHLVHIHKIGMPIGVRVVGHAVLAVAVGFVVKATDVSPAWCTLAGFVALFALDWRARRDRNAVTSVKVMNALVWLTAVVVALSFADHETERIPAMLGVVVITAAFATDRRAERSVLWTFTAWLNAIIAACFALDAAHIEHHGEVLTALASFVATGVVVALVVRHRAPKLPVVAASASALLWLVLIGGGGCAAMLFNHSDHAPLVATIVCALTLVVAGELSRSADTLFAGFATLIVCAARLFAGHDDPGLLLGAALAVLACGGLAFAPSTRIVRAARLLPRRMHILGHSPRARPLALFWLTTISIAMLVVFTLGLAIAHDDDVNVRLTAYVLAAAALVAFARSPSPRALAGAALVLVFAAGAARIPGVPLFLDQTSSAPNGDVATVFRLCAATFTALLGVIALAAVAVGLRSPSMVGRTSLPIVVRLRKRREQSDAAQLHLWPILVVAASVLAVCGVVLRLSLLGDALMHRSTAIAAATTLELAIFVGVTALAAFALFAARAKNVLASIVVVTASLALWIALASRIAVSSDVGAIACALGSIAFLVACLFLARKMYRRGPAMFPFDARPSPSSLRAPAAILVVTFALAVLSASAIVAYAFDATDVARYAPGVAVVAVALFGAAYALVHFRRTVRSTVVAGVVVGLAGTSFDWVSHKAGWLPHSLGNSQAWGAIALVVVVLALGHRIGRTLFARVGLAMPKPDRTRIATLATGVAIALAFIAVAASAQHYPSIHVAADILAGIALVALARVRPTSTTGGLAAFGTALIAAGLAARAIGFVFGDTTLHPLDEGALPLLLAAALTALLVVQNVAARALPDVAAKAARTTAEALAFVALALVVLTSIVVSTPSGPALACTWTALAVAVIILGRSAIDREQTVLAALAQGAALAIYVDLRRRTPWLDDVTGADSIACIIGAGGFLAMRALLPKSSPLARSAELYASTLPVIAAVMGPSPTARALVLVVGGALYAVLARTRKLARYELAAGVAVLVAAEIALYAQNVGDPVLYLFPIAFTATFLARRHRHKLGKAGRSLAVLSHVPLYCTAAYSALSHGTFASFALGIFVVAIGTVYALVVKDRRSLYAAAAAAVVLVGGRLLLAGLDNAVLGTLLLAGCGIALLAGMTIFTIRRDVASSALKRASSALDDWDGTATTTPPAPDTTSTPAPDTTSTPAD